MIWVIASYGWSIEGYESRIYQWSPFSLFVKRSSNLSSVALLILFGAHISLVVGFLWSFIFSETFVLCWGFLLFFFFLFALDWYWDWEGWKKKKTISESLEFLLTSAWDSFCKGRILFYCLALVFHFIQTKCNEICLFWTTSNLIRIEDHFLSWT